MGMIETNIELVRDPFVLVEDDAYYVYGTGVVGNSRNDTEWVCYKNTDGTLCGEWKKVQNNLYIRPENAKTNLWAPEVHKYNGSYYMFTTYYSSVTHHRGCTILKSQSPEGPFVEITNGHITPKDWDAIDGTLFIDEAGQPWMIFVHEWTSTDDGIGRMAAAKLSEDFTKFVSEPLELFRADDPSWTNRRVTDGCFMYVTKDGQLLMLWSNTSDDGYCVGIARSKNGKVDGQWVQDDERLFSKLITKQYDGGHGMIFTDKDGQMYLSVHSPNTPVGERVEKPVFVPIHEENGTLLCNI